MKKLNKKGFSLVELIIVIAIMAVLIGVLAPTYLGQVEKSKRSTDLQNAQEVATALAVGAAQHEANAAEGITLVDTDTWTALGSLTTAPTVQLKADGVWYYKYDKSNVYVAIQTDSKIYQLYPTVAAKDTGDAATNPWK